MIEGWLGRMAARSGSPTADLYLCNALGDRPGLVARSPTVFHCSGSRIIVRHAGGAGLGGQRRRTAYVIDDDIEAGIGDPALPRLYREKLKRLELPCLRRMMSEAEAVVVSSPVLAERLARRRPVSVVAPCWTEPLAGLDHHDRDDRIDIAFMGSGVHRADLELVLPALARLMREEPRIRLHLSLRHCLPAALEQSGRVIRMPSGSWERYRRGLSARRYHIALYPLLESDFNRARSPNKLIEHAIVGSAPVYSGWWREAALAARHGAGLLTTNAREQWYRSVRRLIYDCAERRALAKGAQLLARRLNDPARQRAFWQAWL